MSIPIIWPKDMNEQDSEYKIKVVSENDDDDNDDNDNDKVDDKVDKVDDDENEEYQKPKVWSEVEETGLFGSPVELSFEEFASLHPKGSTNYKKQKKKFCGRDCIKEGQVKKCKELTETCQFHICEPCRNEGLTTDLCLHKLEHNFDRKPPRLNKQTGADHLYNLQFSCYLTMETLLARTDAKYRVDGLTEKLEMKRDAYKACLEEIYDEYGSEIDTVVSPIMTWAMLTSVDIGTSVYENQKKEE